MRRRLFAIALSLSILFTTACGGNNDNNSDTADAITTESVITEVATTEPDTTEQAVEEQTLEKTPLGFNVMFSDSYRNDATGNWRLARIAEDIDMEKYALEYYKNYFKSDDEIHIVINFTRNVTTRISFNGNILDVTNMGYVDGEEHDAKIACSGSVLSEYFVYTDSGEIEQIQ